MGEDGRGRVWEGREAGGGGSAKAGVAGNVAAVVGGWGGLGRRRDGMDADVTTLGFEAVCEEELDGVVKLGRVVGGTKAAAGGPSQGQVWVLMWMLDGALAWPWILGKTGHGSVLVELLALCPLVLSGRSSA